MAIDRIYLDIDDVLADCTVDVMRHMGLDDWERHHHTIEERDIYEMYRVKTGLRFQPAKFWEHFKREFWATLTTTPWCYDLIDLCGRYVAPENIRLLTAPTFCGDCLAGKYDWIMEEMPSFLHRQFIITPIKDSCARPGSVLIDDSAENTSQFRDAGGWPITFPQPWNHCRGHIGEEMEYVTGWLDFYQK